MRPRRCHTACGVFYCVTAAACAAEKGKTVDMEEPGWDAAAYEDHGRFVSDHGSIILEWLAAKPGEVILDAGCGDGALTKEIAELGAVVEGVEKAPSMVAAAHARGLAVREMDLLALEDEARYDAIFSNAVLHWISDWPDLFARFRRALKPGGRLAIECGGFGNIAAIRTAICAVAEQEGVPTKAAAEQYLTKAEAGKFLVRAGFVVERCEVVARPTYLKTGIRGWLSVFREPFIAQFPEGEKRDAVMAQLERLLEPQLMTRDVNTGDALWFADYVRLRFVARME